MALLFAPVVLTGAKTLFVIAGTAIIGIGFLIYSSFTDKTEHCYIKEFRGLINSNKFSLDFL